MNIQIIHNHLKAHGIRPLPNTVAIMRYLLENYNHPTIERIYNDLLPSMPTLSKTTVYNTLKMFCEKKAVKALYIDEKNVRYEAHTQEHAHFRCKKCGSIHDVTVELNDIPPFRGSKDLNPEETHIYFLGKCVNCE